MPTATVFTNGSQRLRDSILVAVLIVACFTAGALAQKSGAAASPKLHSELVVSSSWLHAHLSDPNLVIVNVGDPRDFAKGHIPGARVLTFDKFAKNPGTELLPDDQLKANLEAIGIGDNSRVVIYTADWPPVAARLFFTLNYLGFQNAAMLDGGYEGWRAGNYPISTDEPKITPGSLTIHPHPEIVAKMDAMKELTSNASSDAVIIDSRPLRRYRAGHLPGAVPMFWEHNLQDADALAQMLKNPEALRKMYEQAGAAPGKKIVSYCEVGQQASYTYFIARYLGYDAAMYDGSWSEWSAANQPSVRGDQRR